MHSSVKPIWLISVKKIDTVLIIQHRLWKKTSCLQMISNVISTEISFPFHRQNLIQMTSYINDYLALILKRTSMKMISLFLSTEISLTFHVQNLIHKVRQKRHQLFGAVHISTSLNKPSVFFITSNVGNITWRLNDTVSFWARAVTQWWNPALPLSFTSSNWN